MFYIPIVFVDSVYRKEENCYHKVFLEKINFNEDIEYSDEDERVFLFFELGKFPPESFQT